MSFHTMEACADNMKEVLRYLSPKVRHFVLLAAKVHWTVC